MLENDLGAEIYSNRNTMEKLSVCLKSLSDHSGYSKDTITQHWQSETITIFIWKSIFSSQRKKDDLFKQLRLNSFVKVEEVNFTPSIFDLDFRFWLDALIMVQPH